MTLKRRILTLASIMVLAITMTAGIAIAQEGPVDSEDTTMTITVLCGANNTGPSTASITVSPNATSANFEALDPSDSEQLALRSTEEKALRLTMTIDSCQTGDWYVDATITDFTSGSNVIAGTKFQLPIGGTSSSVNAATVDGDVTVPAVAVPGVGTVTFSGTSPYAGSNAIAIATGPATGSMYMDFTGNLVNLDADTADGTYTAQFTVTWQGGAP